MSRYASLRRAALAHNPPQPGGNPCRPDFSGSDLRISDLRIEISEASIAQVCSLKAHTVARKPSRSSSQPHYLQARSLLRARALRRPSGLKTMRPPRLQAAPRPKPDNCGRWACRNFQQMIMHPSVRNATCISVRLSYRTRRRRNWFSHAKVRSTTQRHLPNPLPCSLLRIARSGNMWRARKARRMCSAS